ncbi:ATP-binding cassette, subfamily B [Sporobacter termitidis DSM 10068]|uniref:ATP-binding cassette, subfamily B n=1 Tax=Sporobacter termitidis DSM 10068 TaxID=1123282 RepID=A0A1M5WIM9_9FIRM|nr:ABC transporter ATP-binding protein [Sporobacter termitidis]SHH87321.1 ATP-binding cassette, subfamily B [Sporobacter termitidis DSM 10068]
MKQRTKSAKAKTGVARLLELAGTKKKKLIAACVLSVLSSAARMAMFFTIYGVVQELLVHYVTPLEIDAGRVYTLVAVTFGAALVYGVCAFISSALAHGAAYDVIYALRIHIMNKLGRIPSGFFTGTTQGAVKKVISDDVEQIEVFVAHHIADIAAAIATPLFTLLYLFIMDWRLALVTLIPIFISLFILGSGLKNPKGAQTQIDMHDTKERMEGTIVEYIHGMPVVKIFNRTLSAFRRFEDSISDYVKSVERTAYHFEAKMGAYYAFFGAQLLFLIPAGLLIAPRAASYADFLPVLLLFFLVGGGLKEPMENMMSMVLHSKRISEGVARIDRILRQPELETTGDAAPSAYDVVFENVSFSYGADDTQAVKNLSLKLDQGSINGLVGPSGGGKSTVAQLLLRFYEPQEGRIKIGGVDIRDIPPEKLTTLVSYVFQDSFLFHDTVENNIRMGNKEAPREAVVQAAMGANIHDVIVALPKGYDTVIGEADAYLSGGERQRIAIARIFLKNTPIVILDEATAYADAENESKIQQAFARLAANKTVLVIAHRIRSIQNANQILVLKQGQLLGAGTHETLLAGFGLYSDMVDANERRDRWTIRKGAVTV